ncbi:hypothetical protein [Mycolicibacterium pyrenivorans]|nr:hypothetical protein [Mycolicibacterium pyrenivorans]MCV7150676.1 hypothetical protein [Mycolicibacterium pyrenivorans]
MPRRNGTRPGLTSGSTSLCKTFGVPAPVTFFPAPLGRPKYARNYQRSR